VLLGESSYALYIIHMPLGLWISTVGVVPAAGSVAFGPFLLLYLVVATGAAVGCHLLIEQPMRVLIRRAYASPRPIAAPLSRQ
jgi:peptidoglycan/LPS O-acetylase OafA/YrhL